MQHLLIFPLGSLDSHLNYLWLAQQSWVLVYDFWLLGVGELLSITSLVASVCCFRFFEKNEIITLKEQILPREKQKSIKVPHLLALENKNGYLIISSQGLWLAMSELGVIILKAEQRKENLETVVLKKT